MSYLLEFLINWLIAGIIVCGIWWAIRGMR